MPELILEPILELIVEGETYREIAKKFGVSISMLHRFLAKEEHSARAREALDFSASAFADKGEQVLIEAEANKEELMRARELAQHYRWKASKRNPQKYGDKQEIQHTIVDVQKFKVGNQEIEF